MIQDRECLLNVREWPSFAGGEGHFCCLKKPTGKGYEHAFVTDWDNPNGMGGEIVVALGSVFEGGTGETVTFKSVDDLLSQGWLVD